MIVSNVWSLQNHSASSDLSIAIAQQFDLHQKSQIAAVALLYPVAEVYSLDRQKTYSRFQLPERHLIHLPIHPQRMTIEQNPVT